MAEATDEVLTEVLLERQAQDAKWGEQNHPDIGWTFELASASWFRRAVERGARDGTLVWIDILLEEVAEAHEAETITDLRDELIQVAAVAVAWVECIDRRPQHQDTRPLRAST